MAILIWLGGTSTDSTTLSNWKDQSTGSAPTVINATDTFYFDTEGVGDCLLNQTTVAQIHVFQTFGYSLTFNQSTLGTDAILLEDSAHIKFSQTTTTITFTGNHPSITPFFDHPILAKGTIDYSGSAYDKTTVLLKLANLNSNAAYFTNGNLPKIQVLNGKWTTNVSAVEGSYGKCETPYLQIDGTVTFENTPIAFTSTKKHIQVTGESQGSQFFKCTAPILDFSNAKLTIDANVNQVIPCTNDKTNYGDGTEFLSLLEDFVVGNARGVGNRLVIPEGLTLMCQTLEVQSGSFLFGGGTTQTSAKSNIHCVGKLTLRGTWNFEEVSDGMYSTLDGVPSLSTHEITVNNAHVLTKLTVDGLIDPTGLVIDEKANVSATGHTTTAGKGLLWVKDDSPNNLYFTDDAGNDVAITDNGALAGGGGGGGSGTVTSVGFSVPTGFTISGSPITTSGTLGLAFDTGYALPTSAKQTNWDTAYGWGDHSTQGYLTSFTESDPVFSVHPASSITVAGGGDVSKGETAFGWGNHASAGYLTSAPPETDPIFSVSAAASITNAGSGDISQGDTAFGWGDHSTAGYASATPEVCIVNLATSVANFTPTGAYTLLQQTGNWASPNPNFNTLTGLYTVATDGVYRISWSNSFRFTPVGQLQASRIYVNGNPAAQGTTSSSGAWPIGSASVLLTLSAGDTVGLYVYISTSGTTLVGDNLVPYSNHMSINKVSN